MKRIGIEEFTHDIYESSSAVWYSVWPTSPIVSGAAFVDSGQDLPALDDNPRRAKIVFREDSFDPVTRIRRGRFYQSSDGSQPWQYDALPHPVYGNHGSQISRTGGLVERQLFTFDQLQRRPPQEMVAIGSGDSLWRVLGAERIMTSEYLVTLKARHASGVLPELNPDQVPDTGKDKAVETFEKLIDAAYRETPGSIVDRTRDAAQWFIATWAVNKYGDNSLLHEDLGSLVETIDRKANKPQVILSAARIIARLHSRGKPNEQERYPSRPLMEADAEFALAAVGLLLREFHWTR